MRSSITYITVLLCGALLVTPTAVGQYDPAQLFSLSRSGAQAGTSIDLRVGGGNNLAEITSLHFSNPLITAELKTLDPYPFSEDRRPDYGNFVVTIPSNIPAGRYEVRASGRHGVSNPRAFLVSTLPNETPAPVSHEPNSPTPLALSTLIHGTSTAAEIDFYRVTVANQQSLRIELLAQQLDSRMIGQLKLYDATGHQVASSRGADDVDPLLRTPEDLPAGEYILAVHDFLYRGGNEYHYQVVARAAQGAVSLVRPTEPSEGQLPEHWATRSFTSREEKGLENPASPSESPTNRDIPFESTQWFPDPQTDAVFHFAAKEGDLLSIDVSSHRVGQPTDARVTVQRMEPQPSGDPTFHDVLNIDDCQGLSDGAINLFSTDPVAILKAPATAEYRLAVRDLDVGKSLSRGQAFRLRVGPPQPGFDLVAYHLYPHSDINQTQPIGSNLFRGGGEVIRVFVIRRDGWSGAVKVSCQGLPPGVSAGEAIIAPNQSQTQLTLTASEEAAASVVPIRIVGKSEDGIIQQEATAAIIQWGKGSGRDFTQSRITSDLWVSVSERDLSPISISLGDGKVAEVKKGESLKLPVKLSRREGGQDACVVRARDLPGGVKAGDVTIPAESSEAEYEFKVESGAATGTYSLWLQVETKIKLKPNPQGLERAERYRSLLQTLHDNPAQADNLEAIKAAIAEADKRVEAAKGAAKEKEMTVFLPTSNATIRVVDP